MRHASILCALTMLLLLVWGCGDNEVCQNFDSITSQSCEVDADCSDINCEQLCSSELSDSRGGAFCNDARCYCPCRVCVGTN